MDRAQRELWDSILVGHAPVDDLELELLLAEADDDAIKWVVRGFEPGADELLTRWQVYTAANLAQEAGTDAELIKLASQWTAEVSRSAAMFELSDLVEQCGMDLVFGGRPTRSDQLDYLDWVSLINRGVSDDPDQQVAAPELRDAYWGATNFHEFVWYLAAPVSALPVDPTPCIELLGNGALCWISTTGPVIERFR